MNNRRARMAQDKHRTTLAGLEKAALLYAERKLDDPINERDPITKMEEAAIEFLTKIRDGEITAEPDEPEPDTDRI